MQVKCGDRVCVSDRCEKYNGKLCGLEGTVMIDYPGSNTIGVSFPNMYNSASQRGLFWIARKHLKKVENREEKITMIKGYTAAGVKFLSGSNTDKEYFYACYDQRVMPGDMVVLSTAHHGFALGRVESIGGPASYVTENREIVCLVDLGEYYRRQDAAMKLAELTVAMDEMVKKYQATALYEMVAEKNPAMRQLLDSFRAVSGANYPGEEAGK